MALVCNCFMTEEEIRDKQINAEIRQSVKEVHKLVLLGTGECGKSTLIKQMRILHLNGYQGDELVQQKGLVLHNTVSSMLILLEGLSKCNLEIESEENKMRAERLIDQFGSSLGEGIVLTPSDGEDIQALWKDEAIQQVWLSAAEKEIQIIDSASYFCDNIIRISDPNYIPTQQDVLRTRVRTTGISETEFDSKGITFKVIDVGGQRNERRKWIHCFEDVTAVIFVAALSEYDQKLREDDSQNRMEESMNLFHEIVNSHWFTKANIILFLNKVDLFKEKLKRVPLTTLFPEYDGGDDCEKAAAYIGQRFLARNQYPNEKSVYDHNTCATDTHNVKFVFEAVQDMLMQGHLDQEGF